MYAGMSLWAGQPLADLVRVLAKAYDAAVVGHQYVSQWAAFAKRLEADDVRLSGSIRRERVSRANADVSCIESADFLAGDVFLKPSDHAKPDGLGVAVGSRERCLVVIGQKATRSAHVVPTTQRSNWLSTLFPEYAFGDSPGAASEQLPGPSDGYTTAAASTDSADGDSEEDNSDVSEHGSELVEARSEKKRAKFADRRRRVMTALRSMTMRLRLHVLLPCPIDRVVWDAGGELPAAMLASPFGSPDDLVLPVNEQTIHILLSGPPTSAKYAERKSVALRVARVVGHHH